MINIYLPGPLSSNSRRNFWPRVELSWVQERGHNKWQCAEYKHFLRPATPCEQLKMVFNSDLCLARHCDRTKPAQTQTQGSVSCENYDICRPPRRSVCLPLPDKLSNNKIVSALIGVRSLRPRQIRICANKIAINQNDWRSHDAAGLSD